MKKLRVRFAAIAILLALAATQCGGGDDGSTSNNAQAPTGATGSVRFVMRGIR